MNAVRCGLTRHAAESLRSAPMPRSGPSGELNAIERICREENRVVTPPLLLVLAAAIQAAPRPSCPELRSRADAAHLEGSVAEAADV